METIDNNWHLCTDEDDTVVTEFELQLWRVYYGFVRWQEECESSTGNTDLVGNELAILHIIRMRNTPKTILDIGRLLNRGDVYNIRYSIAKLLKLGLIKKVKSNYSSKNFLFQITEIGIKNTDDFTRMRKRILVNIFKKQIEGGLKLEELAAALTRIKSIYDDADHAVAFYKSSKETDKDGEKSTRGKDRHRGDKA